MTTSGEAPASPQTRRRRPVTAAVAAVVLAAGTFTAVNATPASAATVDTTAWYVLVNRNSGKALDVYGLATTDGARITQWTRNDGANQQWQFVDSGGGYYRIKSRHSGKVLDVSSCVDRRRRRDPAVDRPQRRPTSSSGWPTPTAATSRLINRNSSKAVEVQGASTADGGERRPVRRLGRQQPAVAAGQGGRRRPGPRRPGDAAAARPRRCAAARTPSRAAARAAASSCGFPTATTTPARTG